MTFLICERDMQWNYSNSGLKFAVYADGVEVDRFNFQTCFVRTFLISVSIGDSFEIPPSEVSKRCTTSICCSSASSRLRGAVLCRNI